ncbi:hypothetical protein RUM44_002157 [Polyplax serrata]|uniref:Cytochrome c oxidase subunit 5B, mitochondrial n=1 Tax=Polyplax serrata TaxID=468196 RepID=A0ABR1AM33_POLSC
MALLLPSVMRNNLRSTIAVCSRACSGKAVNNELATGWEKFQLEQIKAGVNDPFKMKAIKRHASSKSNPNLIPSYYDCRIVGCICEEDSSRIIWMWLFKGEPKRCKCGHWFKLEPYKPF